MSFGVHHGQKASGMTSMLCSPEDVLLKRSESISNDSILCNSYVVVQLY